MIYGNVQEILRQLRENHIVSGPLTILRLDDIDHPGAWSSWTEVADGIRSSLNAKVWMFNHPGHVYRVVQLRDFDMRSAEQQRAEGGEVRAR